MFIRSSYHFQVNEIAPFMGEGGVLLCAWKIWRDHFLVRPNQGQVLGNQSSPVAQPTCSCKPETRKRISLRAPTHRRGTPLREKWYYLVYFICARRQTPSISTASAWDGSKQKTITFVSLVCGVYFRRCCSWQQRCHRSALLQQLGRWSARRVCCRWRISTQARVCESRTGKFAQLMMIL